MKKHKRFKKSYQYKPFKLPNRKRNLLTNEFLQDFKTELLSTFSSDIKNMKLSKINYYTFYQAIESTCGFGEALRKVCKKHNITNAIYRYSGGLDYYSNDDFDSEITILMYKNGIIEEGNYKDY